MILWAPNANLQRGEGSKKELEFLGKVIPNMVALDVFVWDAQYPIIPWFLEILKRHCSNLRLYIRHPYSETSAQALQRLHGLPCLFSLDVILASGQYLACKELDRLLDSCRLKDLCMDTSFYCASEVRPVLEPLQLRSLEVHSCLNNTWRPAVEWPKLQRLSTDSISWIPEVASQLTNLSILQLQVEDKENGMFLPSFLRSCKGLKELDVSGFTSPVKDGGKSLWRHLGKTLLKLRFNETRADNRRDVRPSLVGGEIEMIASECPKLRSLGLEIRSSEKGVSSSN